MLGIYQVSKRVSEIEAEVEIQREYIYKLAGVWELYRNHSIRTKALLFPSFLLSSKNFINMLLRIHQWKLILYS